MLTGVATSPMRLTHITVKNFRGLREVDLPASRFVCVIGENNTGKSSLLQALLLFVEGRKIDPSYYFDPDLPITIAIRFESITDADLSAIANVDHRGRFSEILSDGSITLVRRYETGGASRLRHLARVPNDRRFDEEYVDSLMQGKKSGPEFAAELSGAFPELADELDSKTNQKQARALIARLAARVDGTHKHEEEIDLPAGFDNTIRPLLPDPIYIPAVKDLADEIATKDSASFGKLLGILLNEIAPELGQAKDTFEFLKRRLNRVQEPDGSLSDERLDAVKRIEALVERHVKENFPRVGLDIRIPPPEIKAVLSAAQIWVDDGVPGALETKGDGLKRTVTFSILRSFVELSRMRKASGSAAEAPTNHLFLFEEPELYLHPTAQRALFEALAEIARTNHVFVSTHSPLFFGPEDTGTFIKLAKRFDTTLAAKPFGQAHCVDLGDLDSKSRFQIISYETNNTAFFSKAVVLVEGDSELLVMPHLARCLNPEWDAERSGVTFCRIGGKGNISRYRRFFQAFNVRVSVVADLDCVLDGFEHLEPSPECLTARQALLDHIDKIVRGEDIRAKPSGKEIRDIQQSSTRREEYRNLIETVRRYKDGTATRDEVDAAENRFFVREFNCRRRQVLEEDSRADVTRLKQDLLRLLRRQSVHLLERGSIEDYYPPTVAGPDKPSRAIDLCRQVNSGADALALCPETLRLDGVSTDKEFTIIFRDVFEGRQP